MRQFPSFQLEPDEFERELGRLDEAGINAFIAGPFSEEIARVESEAKAWDRLFSAGQADVEYLTGRESEFQAQADRTKRLAQILLREADQRARDYSFQIRWWINRLEGFQHGSRERVETLHQRQKGDEGDETLVQPQAEEQNQPPDEYRDEARDRMPPVRADAEPPPVDSPQQYTVEELRAENEDLRRLLQFTQSRLRRYEQESEKTSESGPDVQELAAQVDTAHRLVADMAAAIRDSVGTRVTETPVIDENEPWALRERLNLLERLYEEMKRQKEQFFEPSLQTSKSLIRILNETGMDTAVYEESLEVGNVGAVVIVERVLRELAQRLGRREGL